MNHTRTLTWLGIGSALFSYVSSSGMTLPTTKQEVGSMGFSLLLAAMGYFAQGIKRG